MSQSDLHQHPFSLKLTNEQKTYINAFLPKGYSLQLCGPSVGGTKNPHSRKININYKEESLP
jgi:hypothetical protein